MYRSYSYNDMPKPIMNPKTYTSPRKIECDEKKEETKKCDIKKKEDKNETILGNLQVDDIILLVVILALILDDCEDKLLIGVLGFVFLSQFFD